ncbi:glycoside hydrolase family 30 beta sandwich domain-containing protein [Nostoc sp. NIES-2111]
MLNARTHMHIACLVALSLLFTDCKKKTSDNPTPNPNPNPTPTGDTTQVKAWITTPETSGGRLSKQNLVIRFRTRQASASNPLLEVDETQRFQAIEGLGAAVTGSSAYLIRQKMNATQRAALLQDLFGTPTPTKGIGLTYSRMTIGASDFSLNTYSYDDMPPGQADTAMVHFSLGMDSVDVVPVLQQIYQLNPGLKLMGTPWSPPGWMKTSGSMIGGTLKPEYERALAKYFIRYIRAFQAKGIPVEAVSVQNEPLFQPTNYPGMIMQPDQQARFIGRYLGPSIAAAGLQTKIFGYDHNWDRPDYPLSLLGDAAARPYIAGTAFHGYGGSPDAMSSVRGAYPDKGIYFTEQSGGDFAPFYGDFAKNLKAMAQTYIIGNFRNWARSVLFWNLALDESYGPHNGGCTNCTGLVTINTADGTYRPNVEYFVMGHVSKFVRPGAVRIQSTSTAYLPSVAFQNPDGTKVLVVLNTSDALTSFEVKSGDRYYLYSLAGGSLATLTWN